MSNTFINNNNISFFDSVTESQIDLPTHINIIDKNTNLSGGKQNKNMYGGKNFSETSSYSKQNFNNINDSETSIFSKQNKNMYGGNYNDSDTSVMSKQNKNMYNDSESNIMSKQNKNIYGGYYNDSESSTMSKQKMHGGNNNIFSDTSAFSKQQLNNFVASETSVVNDNLSDTSDINNVQNISSTTSDIKSSSLVKNLVGGNLNNVESENNIQKLLDMISSDSNTLNQNGGENDINKLLDMLTTDSNDSFKKYSDTNTNTTDLEKQLESIINKNQSGGFNKNKNINNLFVNNQNQCGGNNGLSVHQIKDFFNNLKLNGVDVNIKLDDHSMSEYFDLMQNTTTNINQDGGRGVNPSFQALMKLRKEVAKRFNIPNGPPAVKIASAMIKDIKTQNPSYDSVKAADEAIKNFDKISNKYKSMIKK